MSIDGNGNVGIGTVNPTGQASDNRVLQIYGAGTANRAQIHFTNSNTGEGTTDGTFLGIDSGTDFYIVNREAAATIFENNGTERMRITSGGNVGIGMTGYGDMRLVVRGATSNSSNFGLRIENSGASNLFQVRNDGLIETSLGTGTVYSTGGALSVVSDMNLKIEDGYIDNALEKVLNLIPRYFHWKKESKLPTDLRQLGFYAQEVNLALGEEAANTPKENEYFGINDRAIIAFLTKAIQEQQAQIEELKELIKNK
jgi:hypothetical protein